MATGSALWNTLVAKLRKWMFTMLVMQTLQVNISDDLPKTAFLKFIDFWLLFGMMVPFVVFLVLCILEALPSEKETNLRKFGSDVITVKSGAKRKRRIPYSLPLPFPPVTQNIYFRSRNT